MAFYDEGYVRYSVKLMYDLGIGTERTSHKADESEDCRLRRLRCRCRTGRREKIGILVIEIISRSIKGVWYKFCIGAEKPQSRNIPPPWRRRRFGNTTLYEVSSMVFNKHRRHLMLYAVFVSIS